MNKSQKKKKIRLPRGTITHLKCWKLMSELVRREEQGICFTCGKRDNWKNCQAGHFKHSSQDFVRENIHCQCIKCNKWLSGNLSVYTLKLIDKYGIKKVKELDKNSWIPHTYSAKELTKIHNNLKEKLAGLDCTCQYSEASKYITKVVHNKNCSKNERNKLPQT